MKKRLDKLCLIVIDCKGRGNNKNERNFKMTLFNEAEARWIDRKFEELDRRLNEEEREEEENEN